MKLGWVLPVLLLLGLLLAPNAASNAAADAALLWWTRVLPSLLPYLIVTGILERSGFFERLPKCIAPLLLWLFGALGGYPVGARLTFHMKQTGSLTERDARRVAVFVNLPNPVFMISVVAFGLFQSARVILPLLLGVYGVAALGLIPLSRIPVFAGSQSNRNLCAKDLPIAIEAGVRAILVIGGCMIFASVLGAVTQASGVVGIFRSYESAAHAVLLGIFEMTCGVRAFASLTWPLSVRLALCAACVQFGGCSVLLQTAAQADISMPRYAMLKVLFAVLTAAITGILTRFLCPDTALPTMATRTEMLQNGGTLLSVTFSACIGLLAVFVLTYGFRHTKKTR